VDTAPAVDVTAYEGEVARDLARRALIVAPLPIILGAIFGGAVGALSAALGLVLVAVNFLVAARLVTWAARHSPGALMGMVLGGYLVRMALLFAIALALGQLSFIDLPILLITVAVVHLALLVWETRHVGLSMASPGLKPSRTEMRSYRDETIQDRPNYQDQ
jgi:hypothetical protein